MTDGVVYERQQPVANMDGESPPSRPRNVGADRRVAVLSLADHLFGAGEAAASPPQWRTRYLVVAAALAAVLFLRRPDAILNPQFWAEDGRIYFSEQITLGFWTALLKCYKGFPYVIERGIGALAAALPLAAVPLAYNAASIAVTALSMAMFSLPAFRHLIRSDVLRLMTCFAIVCVPAGQELVATATNVGWWLTLWLVFASVASAPRTLTGTIGWCLGGALAVLSSPLAPVAAPLWVLRAVHGVERRRPSDVSFAAVQLVTLATLLLFTKTLGAGDYLLGDGSYALLQPGAPLTQWEQPDLIGGLRMVPYVTAWTFDAALLPPNTYPSLRGVGTAMTVAPPIVVALVIGYACRDLSARGRTLVALAVYLFIASISITLVGRHDLVRGFEGLQGAHFERAGLLSHRYRLLPNAALVLAAAAILEGARHVRTRGMATLLVCMGLLAWIPEFRVQPFRDEEWPMWAARLQQKLASGNREPLVIPINPRGSNMAFDPAAATGSDAAKHPSAR